MIFAAADERPLWNKFEPTYVGCYISFMPIYEFHCGKCGRDSEILVRSTDWKNTGCPHCGSKKLSKKFSTFASAGAAGGKAPSGNGGGGHHCCGGSCRGHGN